MKISQDIKDTVKFDLESGVQYSTESDITVELGDITGLREGYPQVEVSLYFKTPSCPDPYLDIQDCLELSVFFKKLAKKLQATADA